MKALDQAFARVRPHSHSRSHANLLCPAVYSRTAPLSIPLLNRRPSPKVLQVQSALTSFTSPLFFSSNRSISTTSTTPLPMSSQLDINRTLAFWFDSPSASQNWFQPSDPEAFDTSIRT